MREGESIHWGRDGGRESSNWSPGEGGAWLGAHDLSQNRVQRSTDQGTQAPWKF